MQYITLPQKLNKLRVAHCFNFYRALFQRYNTWRPRVAFVLFLAYYSDSDDCQTQSFSNYYVSLFFQFVLPSTSSDLIKVCSKSREVANLLPLVKIFPDVFPHFCWLSGFSLYAGVGLLQDVMNETVVYGESCLRVPCILRQQKNR